MQGNADALDTGTGRTRHLAAIMAADLAGYSRLMRMDEDGTLTALRDLTVRILNPAIADHGGRVVKSMGDGQLIEFASVVGAIRCAIAIQSQLAVHNGALPPQERMEFRIGINIGDVIAEDGDVFGNAVNVAARLETIADPGGICISEAALQQASGRIDMATDDLGNQALKNIETPVRVFRIRQAGTEYAGGGSTSRDGRATAYDAPAARPSLAILPFRNLGASPESAFVADGIALGLQTLLVQLHNMFFVNACGHQGYRAGQATAAQALAHVPVQYAVEGWVQHAGDRVRVNVQMIDIGTGTVLWASQYDRGLGDLFALQDEIARRIAAALSIELIGGHVARDFTGSLDSPGAWEHFLRGINAFYRMTRADHAEAIPHFEALAQAHPDSAIGPCYLSVLHYYAVRRGWVASSEAAMARAEYWARRAVALEDGNNGLGHAVLGAILLEKRCHDESLRLCHTAVGYRASCPFAHMQLGVTQTYLGDNDAGVRSIRTAISLRLGGPQPPELNALAVAYRDHGDVTLSISAAEEATRIDPGFTDALITLSSDLALSGQTARAAETARELLQIQPDFSVEEFINQLPYQDDGVPERIAKALRRAGLPG